MAAIGGKPAVARLQATRLLTPPVRRPRGGNAAFVAVTIAVSVIFGVYSGVAGLWG
jgi:hypothetical protein